MGSETPGAESSIFVRQQADAEREARAPTFAVWELTMHCDQPCGHCGSRAGQPRPNELSTAELLEVARSLVRLGVREVGLIGGEVYLRPDSLEIISLLSQHGVRVGIQTGGRALTLERARALRDAGLTQVGVSIDGTARVHDRLRGNLGSHAAAMRALDNAAAVGL
jgi:MoaA/NifB/PqqE/SkfB family radical SAM enzyme